MRTPRSRSIMPMLAVLALVAAACSNSNDNASSGASSAATSSSGGAGVCASVDATGSDALAHVCANGELRIATDQKYKPQSWFDVKTSTWKGFDVEVATEIAKRLGVAPAIQHQDWDIVTAGSWNDRWDISVGSMTDTKPREQLFFFTPPYYYTPAGVAVFGTNSSYTQPSDLSGKKVCVGESTTYQSYLQGNLVLGGTAPEFTQQVQNAQIFTSKTDTDALDQLNLGDGVRCDGASSAVPTIQQYINDGGNIKLIGDPIFYEPLCAAFDKNDPVDNQALVGAVDKIIQDMHSDGTLTALSMKWYGTDLTSTVSPSG